MEHSPADGHVGSYGHKEGAPEDDDGRDEVHQLCQGHMGARQVEQRGDITEKVIEDIGATVGQTSNA